MCAPQSNVCFLQSEAKGWSGDKVKPNWGDDTLQKFFYILQALLCGSICWWSSQSECIKGKWWHKDVSSPGESIGINRMVRTGANNIAAACCALYSSPISPNSPTHLLLQEIRKKHRISVKQFQCLDSAWINQHWNGFIVEQCNITSVVDPPAFCFGKCTQNKPKKCPWGKSWFYGHAKISWQERTILLLLSQTALPLHDHVIWARQRSLDADKGLCLLPLKKT